MIDLLDKKYLKFYLLGIVGLSIIIILIIIISSAVSRRPDRADDIKLEVESPIELRISDYPVPEEWVEIQSMEPVPSREPHSQWTEEEIEKFWIDTDLIIDEYLREESRKTIEEILEKVP